MQIGELIHGMIFYMRGPVEESDKRRAEQIFHAVDGMSIGRASELLDACKEALQMVFIELEAKT